MDSNHLSFYYLGVEAAALFGLAAAVWAALGPGPAAATLAAIALMAESRYRRSF